MGLHLGLGSRRKIGANRAPAAERAPVETTWAALDVYQAFAFATLSHFTSEATEMGIAGLQPASTVGPRHHGSPFTDGFTAW
jgi:hypothetical protein